MSKVCLIIGGTGGLGRACAEDLAKDHIVIVAGRNQTKGDDVVAAIKSAGGEAVFMSVDVTDPASISSLHKQVMDKYGRLDVAVNAAGILARLSKLADTTPEEWHDVMTINVSGVYFSMVEQIKAMMAKPGEKKGGRIVNFSSIYGLHGCKWGSLYDASKHALIGLTRSAALDYAADDILINAVAPGIILTEMTAGLDPTALPEGELKSDLAVATTYPQGKFGEATDVSRGVRYLIESPWTTGTVLGMDGGWGAG